MEHVNKAEFSPTGRSLPILLLRVRELLMESIRPMLAEHDITEQQWRVLRVISEEGTPDASTVADKACLLAPSLTRILRTLVSKGHIEVLKDAKDGRRTLMRLSKRGAAFLDKVAPDSTEVFVQLRSIVGEARWESLVALLIEIHEDIKETRGGSGP